MATPIKDFFHEYSDAFVIIGIFSCVSILIVGLIMRMDKAHINAITDECNFIKEVIDPNAKLIHGICISKSNYKVYIYTKSGSQVTKKELQYEQ